MIITTITPDEQTNKKILLNVPVKNTAQYGINLITSRSIIYWNDVNKINYVLKITWTNFAALLKHYFFQK